MGVRNVLIEGVSGSGKSSVCHELRRRGSAVVDGDRELAYRGDPETGEPVEVAAHEHHIWPVETVRRLAADRRDAVTYFCGGSRNWSRFLDVFDVVVVLHADLATVLRRLERRGPDEFGGRPEDRVLVRRLHATGEDLPPGVRIDSTRPLDEVVDEVVRLGAGAP